MYTFNILIAIKAKHFNQLMQLKDVWVCNEEALTFRDDHSIVYPVEKKSSLT